MSQDLDIITEEDWNLFKIELKSKLRAGIRTPINILYIFMTLIGVGWASWAIPVMNKSSITPETIGIYVIGFLITVGLDALLVFKRTGDENRIGQTISVLIMIFSVILIMISSILSLKSYPESSSPDADGVWRCSAYFLLPIFLAFAILMSLVLTGFDTEELHVGPIDLPPTSITNRN